MHAQWEGMYMHAQMAFACTVGDHVHACTVGQHVYACTVGQHVHACTNGICMNSGMRMCACIAGWHVRVQWQTHEMPIVALVSEVTA